MLVSFIFRIKKEMSNNIGIRVDDDLRQKIKKKADESNLSLSDFVRGILEKELGVVDNNILSSTKSNKKAHEFIKIWVVSVDELKQLSASKGFKSVSAFIRFLIDSDQKIYSETDIDMVQEVRKIGVNINQIAKAHNQNKARPLTDIEFKTLNNLERLLNIFIQSIYKR